MHTSSLTLLAAIVVCFLIVAADASNQHHQRRQHRYHAAREVTPHAASKHSVGDYLPGSVLLITNSTFSSNAVFYPSFPINYLPADSEGGRFVMTVAGNVTGTATVQTKLTFIVNTTVVPVDNVYYDPIATVNGTQTSTAQTLVPLSGHADLATLTLTQEWSCDNSLQSYLLQLIIKKQGAKDDYRPINYVIDPYISGCYNPYNVGSMYGFSSIEVTNPHAAFVQGVEGGTWSAYFKESSSQMGTGFIISYLSKYGYLVYENNGTVDATTNLVPGTRADGSSVVEFETQSAFLPAPSNSTPSAESCQNHVFWIYRVTVAPREMGALYQDISINLYDYTCYQWQQQQGNSTGPTGPTNDDDTGVKKIVIIGLIIAIALVLLAVIVGLCIKRSSGPSSDAYQAQV